jgi:hypothetical protein
MSGLYVAENSMGTSTDRRTADRLLTALENGGSTATDLRFVAETLDPVLLFVIVKYLRQNYPASDRAAGPVLQRVVELTQAFPALVANCSEGESDPVSTWFASEYDFSDFRNRGPELIGLIVDKLES